MFALQMLKGEMIGATPRRNTQISRIMANASSGEHFTPTTAWARAFAEQRVTAKLPAGCLNHRSPLFVKEPLCVLIAFGEQDTYFRDDCRPTR